jgi:iron complex outermembrane receptor protein
VYVDGRSLNLGRTSMQGIDFDTRYRMQVGAADTLTFQLNGSYLTAYDVAFTPGGDYTNLLNNIYQPLTFKARAAVAWDRGPFNGRLMINHVNGYDNDTVSPVQSVKSYTPVDLSFRWQMGESFNVGKVDALTLGVELLNVFDTDPPFVDSRPGANGGGGYDATVTNPVGRAIAVSLRSKF